jgi:exodeoxyribonuclease V alpha subunit
MSQSNAAPATETVTVALHVRRIVWTAADLSCVIAVCEGRGGAALPPGADARRLSAIFPGDLGGRVQAGADLDAVGGWAVHPRYGWQLRVIGAAVRAPEGGRGIAAWLAATCEGIGPATAQRIVAGLGADPLEVLRADPEGAAAALGFLRARQRAALAEAARQLRQDPEHIRHFVWCRNNGLGPVTVERAWDRWGAGARAALTEDPYRLCELERSGFLRADALAADLGTDPLAPSRLRAAVLYAMHQGSETAGHTHRSLREAADEAGRLLQRTGRPGTAVPAQLLQAAVAELGELGLLVRTGERVQLPELYAAETEVAALVVRLAGPVVLV